MGHQSKADLYQRIIDSRRASCYSRGYSVESGSRISRAKNCLGAHSRDFLGARWGARRYFSSAASLCALPARLILAQYLAGDGWQALRSEAPCVD
jgi:hypothetical protein